jgi:hypothetical protein
VAQERRGTEDLCSKMPKGKYIRTKESRKETSKRWKGVKRSSENIKNVSEGMRFYWENNGRKLNDEQKKERVREQNKRYRMACLHYYGGEPPMCRCCGEKEVKFLCIDHIDGNGAQHRREIKRKNIYSWLVTRKFPKGFQVLCYNCNCAKGFYGTCPHLQK